MGLFSQRGFAALASRPNVDTKIGAPRVSLLRTKLKICFPQTESNDNVDDYSLMLNFAVLVDDITPVMPASKSFDTAFFLFCFFRRHLLISIGERQGASRVGAQ